jgi:hypothetical protein
MMPVDDTLPEQGETPPALETTRFERLVARGVWHHGRTLAKVLLAETAAVLGARQ